MQSIKLEAQMHRHMRFVTDYKRINFALTGFVLIWMAIFALPLSVFVCLPISMHCGDYIL